MVDERVIHPGRVVSELLEGGLDLAFNLVVVLNVFELEMTFFLDAELESGVEIIDEL
jgi:hypothetical protein